MRPHIANVLHRLIHQLPSALIARTIFVAITFLTVSSAQANYYAPPPLEDYTITVYPACVTSDLLESQFYVESVYGSVPFKLPIELNEVVGHGWVCTGDLNIYKKNYDAAVQQIRLMKSAGTGQTFEVRIVRANSQAPLRIYAVKPAPRDAVPKPISKALIQGLLKSAHLRDQSNLLCAICGLIGFACVILFANKAPSMK